MASRIGSTPPPPPPPSPPGGLNGTSGPPGGLNGTGGPPGGLNGTGGPPGGLNGTGGPPADISPQNPNGHSDPAEQVLSGLGSIAGSIGSAIQDEWDQAGEELATGVNNIVDGMTEAIFGSS